MQCLKNLNLLLSPQQAQHTPYDGDSAQALEHTWQLLCR